MAEERPSRKKMRSPEERSLDPAAREMLVRADELGLETAFSRADQMAPCPIGSTGSCCHVCFMGPCRLVKDGQTGVCGATIETITARNFARAIAAGAVDFICVEPFNVLKVMRTIEDTLKMFG